MLSFSSAALALQSFQAPRLSPWRAPAASMSADEYTVAILGDLHVSTQP